MYIMYFEVLIASFSPLSIGACKSLSSRRFRASERQLKAKGSSSSSPI